MAGAHEGICFLPEPLSIRESRIHWQQQDRIRNELHSRPCQSFLVMLSATNPTRHPMKFIENHPHENRQTDWPLDHFPQMNGSLPEPDQDASESSFYLLMRVARLHGRAGRPVLCARILYRAIRQIPSREHRARITLSIGILAETVGRFESAVSFYHAVNALQPTQEHTRYFGQNNLGYSLNQLGLYAEGEVHCRLAIEMNPDLPNGHKNLGLSLWGQQRFREAAQCFVDATQANALDPRSTQHLWELLIERPEIAWDFSISLEWCRSAVRDARRPVSKIPGTNQKLKQKNTDLLN